MKRLISFLLTITLILSLSACGSNDSAAPDAVDKESGLEYPYNIVNRPMIVDDVYDYKTVCYSDRSLTTDGHIYIYDYIIEPAGDGLVDKTVKAMLIFDDDNAWNYGMSFNVLYADFVNDDTISGAGEWTVQIDGTEYPVTVLQDEFIYGEWTPMGNFVSKYVLTIRMPKDYDDIGLFFYNAQHKLNVAGEDDDIPDGTPINKLVDSHSQWFVLGGKGADWEETKTPTYYGNPIEAQVNNTDIRDVLGSEPVFDISDDVDEDGAPSPSLIEPDYPDEEYSDETFDNMEGFTYVEIDNWSHETIDPNEKMGIRIDYSTYNTFETDYVMAQAFVDGAGEPIFERKVDAYEEGRNSYSNSVTFVIDGPTLPEDATSITFWYKLYDESGTEISFTQMDLPVEEPQHTQSNASVIITDCTPAEINKADGDVNVDISYEIRDYTEDMAIMFSVKDGEDGDIIDFADLETGENGVIKTIIPAGQMMNDSVSIKIRLIDGNGDELAVAYCSIPVKY